MSTHAFPGTNLWLTPYCCFKLLTLVAPVVTDEVVLSRQCLVLPLVVIVWEWIALGSVTGGRLGADRHIGHIDMDEAKENSARTATADEDDDNDYDRNHTDPAARSVNFAFGFFARSALTLWRSAVFRDAAKWTPAVGS